MDHPGKSSSQISLGLSIKPVAHMGTFLSDTTWIPVDQAVGWPGPENLLQPLLYLTFLVFHPPPTPPSPRAWSSHSPSSIYISSIIPLPMHQNFIFFLTVLSLMLLITHLLSPSSCIHLFSYIHLSSDLTFLPPHPPSPPVPASSPLHLLQPFPSLLFPLFHFWSRILSSDLRLLTGTEAPLSAAHISQRPKGTVHMVVGAGCPCHLNLRPEWSRHPPWASLLEVSVGAEGTALAHLSDFHFWMWASPQDGNEVTRRVWGSGGSEQGRQVSERQSRSVTTRASNCLGTRSRMGSEQQIQLWGLCHSNQYGAHPIGREHH